MKEQVTLESEEVRAIIARFLQIPEDQIIPMRYGFAVEGMSAAEIARRIEGAG